MTISKTLVDAIGNTPLIHLRKPSELTGCNILGKAEFMNPGGSVKDRAARFMVLDAESRGELRPGGVIVEGTAGNTGIGLALIANSRGYRTVITMPNTQSREKKDTLRLLGAQLHEVPAVPFKDPGNYVHAAARLAEQLFEQEPNGVLYANQWENLSNAEGHYRSTGPEIWQQTNGQVDAFCCAIGTGGTISGMPVLFSLLSDEGLCLGGSSGINVAGAIQMARALGPGHTIVTILCDSGTRYQSKLFNPDFLRGKDLPIPEWL